MNLTELIFPFILGGFTVSGIKYLSNAVDPKYAAILGALPIGLFSAYYIKSDKSLAKFLHNYSKLSFILILVSVIFSFLLTVTTRMNAYFMSIALWAILVLVNTFILN